MCLSLRPTILIKCICSLALLDSYMVHDMIPDPSAVEVANMSHVGRPLVTGVAITAAADVLFAAAPIDTNTTVGQWLLTVAWCRWETALR